VIPRLERLATNSNVHQGLPAASYASIYIRVGKSIEWITYPFPSAQIHCTTYNFRVSSQNRIVETNLVSNTLRPPGGAVYNSRNIRLGKSVNWTTNPLTSDQLHRTIDHFLSVVAEQSC
jgi:hypothetical protein